jgi:mercuric reductase
MKSYELVILGGGAAAFAAAIKADEFGVNTAMINHGLPLGGTCVNVGCVPSKHLLHVGEIYYYGANRLKGIEQSERRLDFKKIMRQKRKVVARLRERKYIDVIAALSNVTLIKGRGTFVSPSEVKVGGERIHGERFIIATGASPNIIPIDGIDKVDYLTNAEALELEEPPESMIILGGRALALEFAQLFSHFGTQVILLQRSSRIIPNEEPEISEALKTYLELEGVEIHTGVDVKNVGKIGGQIFLRAEIRGVESQFKAEKLLMATGRKPNTVDIGLEKAGVKLGRGGAVVVDKEMRTSAENIWAAGDVVGSPMLETIAAKGGTIAAENALEGSKRKMDYFALPHAIFTNPQVASVGLTDAEALEKGYACNCTTVPMEAVPKAAITGDTRGLVKMVADAKTGQIRGVHILASLAADMIHEAVLAVKYGLTIDDIIDTVHVFPTMSEGIKLAAQSYRRDINKMSCCVE